MQIYDSALSVVGNTITDDKKGNLSISPKNSSVALTSAATTETTIVLTADRSPKGSPTTTSASYSVVVSQCQPESSGKHAARPPADASPDKSAGSYP